MNMRKIVESRRSGAAVAATGALLLTAVGCGLGPQGDDSETTTSELRCIAHPLDGNCPWKGSWAKLAPLNGIDITHNWAPTLIASDPGWVTFSVDSANHYRMLQWHANGRGPEWGYWGGSTATWNSRPASCLKDDFYPGRPGFVVAGKVRSSDANNNKIMVSTGIMAPAAQNPDNPTEEVAFGVLDSGHAYSSGGLPALGLRSDGAGGGSVLMALMGDDGRTVYGLHHLLPYNYNNWTSRITGPALPTGWKVVYAPTVAYAFPTFHIVVHAKNQTTGANALFETYFYTDGTSNGYFANETGSPQLIWKNQVNVGPIDDDPWITESATFGITAYFRRGTNIMETAYPSPLAVLTINPAAKVTFASAPAAFADHFFDQGTVVVVARTTSNQIYYHDSQPDGILEP